MPIAMTELHARFLQQAAADGVPPLVGTSSKEGDP